MLASQRKDYLLEILKKTGQIVAKTVSQELGLSEDTIRRDLRELASEGRLQRVHGGALPASPAISSPGPTPLPAFKPSSGFYPIRQRSGGIMALLPTG